jgi:acetate kinase
VLARTDGTDASAERMRLAVDVYLWRIRKYLGAYLTLVGRSDAVIFTDTIGEGVPVVRATVCSDMEVFGLELDDERNRAVDRLPADVATDAGAVRILVIATNEELAIARETHAALEGAALGATPGGDA